MRTSTLALLECPYCGDELRLQSSPAPLLTGEDIIAGILSCACCAYPIADRVAFIRTGAVANAAMEQLGQGRHDNALHALLELRDGRLDDFEAALKHDRTFRGLLKALGGAESEYLMYRFSDPTFICAEGVATALARDMPPNTCVLDFGGGAGHVTRVLAREATAAQVVLADISFWELWLARTFVEPHAEFVCCDGNSPLPFRNRAFALTFSADAFHYVWSRRLLAAELVRSTDPLGVVALCHLHNADAFNLSPGMPLSARGYRRLFDMKLVRLFAERTLANNVWCGSIDLSGDYSDAELIAESTYVLLASNVTRAFRVHALATGSRLTLDPNPLYTMSAENGTLVLRLRAASDQYEGEFGGLRQYLPDEVRLPADWRQRLASRDPELLHLVHRRVLLDLPQGYS